MRNFPVRQFMNIGRNMSPPLHAQNCTAVSVRIGMEHDRTGKFFNFESNGIAFGVKKTKNSWPDSRTVVRLIIVEIT